VIIGYKGSLKFPEIIIRAEDLQHSSDKKSANNTKHQTLPTKGSVALTEQESLRNIVFGAAKHDIEQRISSLE
jgi:hypothetical protein